MKKYRVLIVHNILWSHYKAAVFSELYKIIDKEKYDIRIIQIALTEKTRKNIGELNIKIHKYPLSLLFNTSFDEVSNTKKIFKLYREFKKFRPHIIIIPGYSDISYWFLAIISKIYNCKILIGFDSNENDHIRKFIKEKIKKVFVKMCDGALCYGTAAKNYITKLGLRKKNAFVDCQAIDNKMFENEYKKISINKLNKKTKYNKHNFLYVGRLIKEKNLERLIYAFIDLNKNIQEAKEWGLIIVGDGPERKRLESIIIRNKIKNCYFEGGKNWKQVIEYYSIADVFILPSLSEPWGLVVNEAMICRLPVIVSKNAGSYYDLVKEGINGFGFEPTDQRELYRIMASFIEGKYNLEIMGTNSYNIIKKYDPENAAKNILKGIEFIINNNNC